MKPKILLIEDSEDYGENCSWKLGEDFDVLWAKTQEEAQELVKAHKKELVLVVMDACVPGHHPNTQALTAWVRSQFSGPIVACSSSPRWAKDLFEYGATHTSEKLELPQVVRSILLAS